MSIEIIKKPDFRQIAKSSMDAMERELTKIMEEAVTEIVRRTQSGTDVNGRSFDKYSPSYAKFREKKGRNAKVDLTFTGRMMGSMTSTVNRTRSAIEGRIFFRSPKEAAKARGNQSLRNFFALSKQQIKEITKRLGRI